MDLKSLLNLRKTMDSASPGYAFPPSSRKQSLPPAALEALRQTQQWCAFRGSTLRTPPLDLAVCLWSQPSHGDRARIISEVITHRSQLPLEISSGPHIQREPPPGKLLHCEVIETVICGASKGSSRGFFDDNDVPPCATWVHFEGETLTCWVPEMFVALAQAGIDANPVDCIHWA